MKDTLNNLNFKAVGEFISKANKDGRRLIRGHASTGDMDRQGEIITLGALVSARNDLLNKAVFLNHMHSELPVGKVISTDIDEKGLIVTVEFTKAEFAKDLWQLIEEGIMNRFSIGGMVREAVEKQDKLTGDYYVEITKIELFEVSVVGLPANDQARFELVSKSFNMAISEEIKKREVKPTMAKEINKEVEEVELPAVSEKSVEEVVTEVVPEVVEEIITDTVVKEEVPEAVVEEVVKDAVIAEEKVVASDVVKDEVIADTSLEEVVEVIKEETLEKSVDEKILETLTLILQYVSKDNTEVPAVKAEEVPVVAEEVVEVAEEVPTVEETVEEVVDEVVPEVSEETVEEVPEVISETVPEAVAEVVTKKVEEVEKELDLNMIRKGEVIIVDTPYSEHEVLETVSESEIKKMKEANWSKLIFGRK